MIQQIFLWMIGLSSALALISMSLSLWSSKNTHRHQALSPMLLPHDFFISIILLFNLWIILLLLLASENLEKTDQQNLILAASILAPGVFWWWKKVPRVHK